jgi:hypothetical protein
MANRTNCSPNCAQSPKWRKYTACKVLTASHTGQLHVHLRVVAQFARRDSDTIVNCHHAQRSTKSVATIV